MPALILEYQGTASHAARGRDGRQEGRERGYYHLHRNLNHSLLHNFSLFTVHYNGPSPMQLVVVMAVRKAVSAATTTFTAISKIRFFIIRSD